MTWRELVQVVTTYLPDEDLDKEVRVCARINQYVTIKIVSSRVLSVGPEMNPTLVCGE